MTRFLLSLSILLAFTGPSKTSGQLPSSVLPGKNNPHRLRRLFKQVTSVQNLPISFSRLEPTSSYLGRTDYQPDRVVISIREGLRRELRENVIAHELHHAKLQAEGYPGSLIRGPDPFMSRLSETILDCVYHPIINRRMKAAGFKPELVWQSFVAGYKQSQFTVDLNNIGFQRLNGLQVYCLSLLVDAASAKSVEETVKKVQPAIVDYAYLLRSRFGGLSCGDPESCFNVAKRLRDAIGFPVVLVNPKTRFPE